MKVYLIYDDFDDCYITDRAIDNKRKYEEICFDSYEKALNFVKEYISGDIRDVRIKGNIVTFYDLVDEMRKKIRIDEINVR